MSAKGWNICEEWSFASINVNPSVSIWRINNFESKFLRKVYLNAFNFVTNFGCLLLLLFEEGSSVNDNYIENFQYIIIDYCCKILGHLEQRFSTQITPRPVFSTTYNFIEFFKNPIEGRDPFKIFQVPLPGRDPVVEKPWSRDSKDNFTRVC